MAGIKSIVNFVSEPLHGALSSLTELSDKPEKLYEAIFGILGDATFEELVPASLKTIEIDELKKRLLRKLRTLSKKAIEEYIEGNFDSLEANSTTTNSESGTDQSRLKSNDCDPTDRIENPKGSTRTSPESTAVVSTSRETRSSPRETAVGDRRVVKNILRRSSSASSWNSEVSESRTWERAPSNSSNDDSDDSRTRLERMDVDELEQRAKALNSLMKKLENEEAQSKKAVIPEKKVVKGDKKTKKRHSSKESSEKIKKKKSSKKKKSKR